MLGAQAIDGGIDHRARDETAGGPDEAVPRAAERAGPRVAEIGSGQRVGRGHDAGCEADRGEGLSREFRRNGRGEDEVMRDDDVVRGRLGEQRGEDVVEAGGNGVLDEGVERDEATPFHGENVGMLRDEVLTRRFAGGDEAQAGDLRLRGPVGMPDERYLVSAREQAAAQR